MQFQSILILTGAGISAESGVDTFRDVGGIWSKVRLEDVATPEGFARDPAMVHDFYNQRRAGLAGVKPNPAHLALARLEREFSGSVTVVTQNIDDLHERAGSRGVIHMHGELAKALCARCGTRGPSPDQLSTELACRQCGSLAGMRPDVVWFGEMPYHMDQIAEHLETADIFASIGTSGQVYPAAGFSQLASEYGAECIELNLEPTSNVFHQRRLGPATRTIPAWAEELIGR